MNGFALLTDIYGVSFFVQSSAVITESTEENEDQTDLNVPALSEVDHDEESLHEPFANSTFATSEIKESTAVRKSPSILKRKRSSIDPNEAKKRKGKHHFSPCRSYPSLPKACIRRFDHKTS